MTDDLVTRLREQTVSISEAIRQRAAAADAIDALRALLAEAALGWEPGAEIVQRIDAALKEGE